MGGLSKELRLTNGSSSFKMAVAIPSFMSMFPKLYLFNVTANASSDFLLHPTNKLDYGFLNPLLGRPVGSLWWNTKTEFILTLSVFATCNEYASWRIFHNVILPAIQKPVVALGAPGCVPHLLNLHCGAFIFANFCGYGMWQALHNPVNDDADVWRNWTGNLYPGLIGASMAVAYMPMAAAPSFKMLPPNEGLFMYMSSMRGFGLSVLAGIPVYAVVKGFSFCDFGELSLKPFERYLNGLTDEREEDAVAREKAATSSQRGLVKLILG